MKSQNSFMLAMLVLFAAVPCLDVRVFGGTIRSDQYYSWGIDTDQVAVPEGSVITEAVITIHNLSSSSDNANDSLYIYLLDEPRVGFVADADDGSSPFEERGVRMVQTHHEQSQGEQDVAYTFSELAVEPSPLWEHFGFPLVFGPDGQMVIESSLILDLIDYAGGGTSFGFGFDPNGNTDYDCDEIRLDLTIESFEGQFGQSFLTFSTTGQASLIGHWTMDDNAANTTVVDSSGNGNDGAAQQNTPAINTTGIIDGALDFDGAGDFVQIADSDSLSPTQEVTVCGWFYFNDASESVGLIWKHNYNYALWTQSDTVRFAAWNPSSENSRATFSTLLLGSGWNFIAGVFDGTNSRLYLNGVQAGTIGDDLTGGIRDRAGDLYIGQRRDGIGERYFDGVIDDVKIFERVLSAIEIQALYNEVVGNLTGYWRMDDNEPDTEVEDSSFNGNHGTAQQNTSAISITGRIDGALSFNGIDDYIQIADSVPLSPTQEVTVCGWFDFDDASENVGLIWKHNYNYALWTQSDTVRFAVWNSSSKNSQATFSTSLLGFGWNFIAGVFDGTNSMLYLNGVQAGTIGDDLTGGIRDRAGDLYIGQRRDGIGERYFDGKIDDVKVFNKALSKAEIELLCAEGSVGYWTMDDDAANKTVLDSSGNDNPGTAQQNTEDIAATGIIDGALSFNGINDYIQIADSVPLSPAQEITVCGWFYFNDASENAGLIWKHNYNYALWTSSNVVRFAVWNPSSKKSQATFSTSLLGSGWNFIAGAFDGTKSRLYLNGVQVGTLGASITGGIRDRAGDLYIGQRRDGIGERYFDGVIDDVKIYGRALTPAEMSALYNLVP